MAEPLPVDDPHLKQAATRLQRVQWVWAGLSAAMAVISWITLGPVYPLAGLPWLAAALLLAVYLQPALLALVAVLWLMSLALLIPGMSRLFGPDPITSIFPSGIVVLVGRAAVRLVLGAMAWNQFLLYRMLYGTERATGLPTGARPIPEVIANRTDRLAASSLALAVVAALSLLAATAPLDPGIGRYAAQLGFACSLLGFGLALGAAFSPTDRRPRALVGLGLSLLAFIGVLAVGRLYLL